MDANAEETEMEEHEVYIGLKDCCGTPAYMAPEVIQTGDERRAINKEFPIPQGDNLDNARKKERKKNMEAREARLKEIAGYGPECDIWSAGVLLYALVYGVMPFRGHTIKDIKTKITGTYKILYKSDISLECRDLL